VPRISLFQNTSQARSARFDDEFPIQTHRLRGLGVVVRSDGQAGPLGEGREQFFGEVLILGRSRRRRAARRTRNRWSVTRWGGGKQQGTASPRTLSVGFSRFILKRHHGFLGAVGTR